MDKRLEIILFALAGLIMVIMGTVSIIRGGLLDLAKAVIIAAPILFILFLRSRKFWHALILIFLVSGQIRIPIYGLYHMTLSLMILSASSVVLILDWAFHHQSP